MPTNVSTCTNIVTDLELEKTRNTHVTLNQGPVCAHIGVQNERDQMGAGSMEVNKQVNKLGSG